MKGIKHSDEHNLRVSETRKGHHVSKETRRKLSIAMTGKIHSEETRRKMSESLNQKERAEIFEEMKKIKKQFCGGFKKGDVITEEIKSLIKILRKIKLKPKRF